MYTMLIRLRRRRSLLGLSFILFAFTYAVTKYNIQREGSTTWSLSYDAPLLDDMDMRPINTTLLSSRDAASPIVLCRTDRWRHCSELCQSKEHFPVAYTYTPNGTIRIYVHDSEDDQFISRSLVNQFVWEANVMTLIWSQLIKYPDAVFIDIGSHVGQFALVAAKMGRQSYAIDPLVSNIKRLCRSISMNNLTTLTTIYGAISNTRDTVAMSIPFKNIGGSTINGPGVIPACYLDDLLAFVKHKQVVMKIDVEAHEGRVLEKGENFFADNDVKFVAMEWMAHRRPSLSSEAIIAFMHRQHLFPMNVRLSKSLNVTDYVHWNDNIAWVKLKEPINDI